jgi:nitroimidazol reductase NimA-like FMN-containing flavoprotein (pyridoxamine 5'-phosphate oxidase superfamily)
MTMTAGQMEELTSDRCWELLQRNEVGRLAVCAGEHPDVFPINYVLDGHSIVFRTAEGTKLASAVLGRAVAFEIDGYDPLAGEAWSVVAKGPAIELGTMVELFAAEDLPLFPWHDSPKPRFVRVRPDEISGRRFTVRRR